MLSKRVHQLVVLSLFVFPSLALAQQIGKKRITVMPLKDRTGSNGTFNISEKVADAIMSKLADSGQFKVIERENLADLQTEKNLKFDADFDPSTAVKSGMLKLCDIVITGQIDEFSAEQTSATKNQYIRSKTQTNGSTALKITTRVTSVETGEILGAPSSRSEKEGLLSESTSTTFVPNVGSSQSNSAQGALTKLVDANIEAVADDVAKKIETMAAVAPVSTAAPEAALPKFAGMEDGLVVLNKGSQAGVKVGDLFDIMRPTDSGLKDPDTGAAIIRRKKLCTVAISNVDDVTSSGKCDGGTPQKGDEIRRPAK